MRTPLTRYHRSVAPALVRVAVALACCLSSTMVHADDGFHLVGDFHPGTQQDDLFPHNYRDTGSVILNGLTLFRGRDEVHGYELWASDGTSLGTEVFFDLAPGPWNGLRHSTFAILDGKAYFVVVSQANGNELWRTDGTVEGTERFLDRVGAGYDIVAAHGRLVFTGWDATHGDEPWVSDGTEGGTFLLADLEPGPDGSEPAGFTAAGPRVYFAATTTASGRELFATDGTSVGTMQVADIEPGVGGSSPGSLTALGNQLLFVAYESSSGRELWRTDGTGIGTVRLDIHPGVGDADPEPMGVVGNTLLFAAADGSSGFELWRTNGTVVQQVIDLDSGSSSGIDSPVQSAVHGGFVYFAGEDGSSGEELWRSDGTLAGTTLVADIRSGHADSSPAALVSANGWLFYSASDGTTGRELWATNLDGTTTQRLTDLDSGPLSSLNDEVTGFAGPNGDFLFIAEVADLGTELWRTTGSPGGALRLSDVTEPLSSKVRHFTQWQDGVAARILEGPNAQQLVTVDGDTLSPTVHTFLTQVDYDGDYRPMVAQDGLLYFTESSDTTFEQRLWTWDGTTEQLVAETASYPHLDFLYAATGGVVFLRDGEIHHSDGTPVATFEDLIIDPALPGGLILHADGEQILVRDSAANEVWRINLANQTAVLYPDITSDGSDWRTHWGTFGSQSVITTLLALDPLNDVYESKIWVTDGTAGGTQAILTRPGVAHPEVFSINGELFVVVGDFGTQTWQMYVTDGTTAGTVLRASGSGYSDDWVAGDDWAIFDTSVGLHLTDGTSAGTTLIPGTGNARPILAFDDWALITDFDDARGMEFSLVSSVDGSIVPLPEIQPGPPSTDTFGNVRVFDRRLWVTAFRADVGYELFTLDLTPFITAPSAALFSDGFESGDTSGWSAGVQ
jgi:ELWxxDGT repeat protein